MITWLFEWIVAPLGIVLLLLFGIAICTAIPVIGHGLYGFAIIYSGIYIILEDYAVIWRVLILLVLALALIDCIHDAMFSIKYGRKILEYDYDDNHRVMRAAVCGATIALGSAWFYYTAPDGNHLSNILANKDVLFTLMLVPRAGFLIADLIARAVIYPKALALIIQDEFFPYNKYKKLYYFERYISVFRLKGLVISNKKTMEREKKAVWDKMEKSYPITSLERLAAQYKISTSAAVSKRHEIGLVLARRFSTSYCISAEGYAKFCADTEQALIGSGTFSPYTFIKKKFPHLLSVGADFFLIQAFDKARMEGRVIDLDISDDPLSNHAYRHVQSTVKPKVINADEDPRLALDD